MDLIVLRKPREGSAIQSDSRFLLLRLNYVDVRFTPCFIPSTRQGWTCLLHLVCFHTLRGHAEGLSIATVAVKVQVIAARAEW